MKTRVSLIVIRSAFVIAMCDVSGARGDFPTTLSGYSPYLWWKLDESAASPAPNTTTNSGTASSAGKGYIVNDVTNAQPGVVGTSFRFTNPGQNSGYCGSHVEIQWSAALNPAPPFTIEFWAKPNALGTDTSGYCPVSSMNLYYLGANRSGWLFYMNNAGRWEFRTGGENSYAGVCTSTNPAFNAVAGSWQHIVGTFDGAIQKLYVNGALVQATNLTATQIANFKTNASAPLRIGGAPFTGISPAGTDFFTGNRGWDGWVDEVAIYTNSLSQATITNHYVVGTNSPLTYSALVNADGPPVGYWHLDEPVYTPAAPSTYPIATNSGTGGTAYDATNWIGVEAAQSGPSYTGSASPDRSSFFNGATGNLQAKTNSSGPTFAGPLTMLAWIKPTEINFRKEIIAHGNDHGGPVTNETFLRIEDLASVFSTGTPYNGYYSVGMTPDGTNYHYATYPVPAPANGNAPGDVGNWVFLAGTYDGNNWALYRNGTLVAIGGGANGPPATTLPWSVGARSSPVDSDGINFAGNIDDAAILTNALSAGQILALYYSATVPPHFTRVITPPSGPVYEGSTLNFNVWAEGSTNLAYQWISNGVAIVGQTATNLTLSNVSTNYSATYGIVVTNNYGSATSSVVVTVLTTLPIITNQPKSITRFASAPITFNVGANSGTPIAYQWRTNGAAISGATSATYSNIAVSDGSYDCILTNIYGSVTSSVATLTVVPLPTGYGSNVVHDAPIAYWRLGETSGSVAHDYVGGNDGTYVNCVLGQLGYSPIDPDKSVNVTGASNSFVGNISGTITFPGTGTNSFSLELWVNGAAGQLDGSTIICKGSGGGGVPNEQFDIELKGGNYEFFVRNPAGNATVINAPVGPDGNWHYLVATYDAGAGNMAFYVDNNPVGSAVTPASGLRVSSATIALGSKRSGVGPDFDQGYAGALDEVAIYNHALTAAQMSSHYAAAYGTSTKPFITLQPDSITNYVSYGLSLRAAAAGTQPLSYQWRKNGVNVPGSTSNTFVIAGPRENPSGPGLQLGDAGSYTVVITNTPGSVTSAVAAVTVLAAPTHPPAIDGLVLHLPLDNNLTDATGRGNNGTAHGGISFGTPGQVGAHYLSYYTDTNAHSFNYVSIGARPDLQFSSNVNFTVAYWIQIPFLYNGGDLPFIGNSTNSLIGFGFVATTTYGTTATPPPTQAHDGGWEFSVYDNSGNGVAMRGDDHSLDDGSWHHLVHVIDRKNGATTYLDGSVAHAVVEGGTSVQNVGNLDSAASWTIGQGAAGNYTSGGAYSVSESIDDVGIWRKALNPLEVAAIYLAAMSNSPAVSFTGTTILPPVTITSLPGNRVQLTWPCGTLQSSLLVTGAYTDVPGAASPWTVTNSAAATFYRTRL